jgi:hypothetical protein
VVSSTPMVEKAMAPMAAGWRGRRYSSGTGAQRTRAASGSVPSGHSTHAVSDTGDRICGTSHCQHRLIKPRRLRM